MPVERSVRSAFSWPPFAVSEVAAADSMSEGGVLLRCLRKPIVRAQRMVKGNQLGLEIYTAGAGTADIAVRMTESPVTQI